MPRGAGGGCGARRSAQQAGAGDDRGLLRTTYDSCGRGRGRGRMLPGGAHPAQPHAGGDLTPDESALDPVD